MIYFEYPLFKNQSSVNEYFYLKNRIGSYMINLITNRNLAYYFLLKLWKCEFLHANISLFLYSSNWKYFSTTEIWQVIKMNATILITHPDDIIFKSAAL